MNKISKKVIVIIILAIILISGVSYGITKVIKKYKYNNVAMKPTYQSTVDEHTINNLWVGTFDLAWKELENQLKVDRIQIEGNDIPQIAADLNASTFTKDMLDEKSYEIKVEDTVNVQKINATLNKELNFLENFDNFNELYRDKTFGDGQEYIKYFGINSATLENVYKNVEILFYNSVENKEDFAVKLKTQEGDEIILYRTDDPKNFDEYYEDIERKTKEYDDIREIVDSDILLIPYVKVNGIVSYDELLGKTIKNTDGKYFGEATQNVNFYLNEKGCNLSSMATLTDTTLGISGARKLYFTDTFIIFMKEQNAEQPYFALKVDNDDILEKLDEEYKGPIVIDYSKVESEEIDLSTIPDEEYKFYEDEDYEYYYPIHKTELVLVSLYPHIGVDMTAEDALKEGHITIEDLDKYGIEYIKKEKNENNN